MTEFNLQREKAESALRTLEASGFDVKQLWKELSEREARADRGTPSEDDRRYELPLECPRTESHLKGGNEELNPSQLWNGLSYSLSPGMRGLLRDMYELTPTMTVTVKWVEPWPGTRFPCRMCLVSDIHIPQGQRRHVLTQVVINKVGEFFRLAAEKDDELRSDGSLTVEKALVLGEVAKLATEERWAIEDLCGVKVETKVEIVKTSLETFTMLCLKTGNKATVNKKEFFTTAAEYVKMNALPRRRVAKTGKAFEVTPALDELIANLSK